MAGDSYPVHFTDRYPWFQPASDEIESGLAQVCGSCWRSNAADAAFCANCGQSLA